LRFNTDLTEYLTAHTEPIYALEQHGNHTFYSGGGDGHLLYWDLNNTSQAHTIAKTSDSIYLIKYLGDDRLILGTNSGDIYLIDRQKKQILAENNLGQTIFDCAIIRPQKRAFVTLANGHLSSISLESLEVLQSKKIADDHLRCITSNSDSSRYAIGASDGSITLVDTDGNVILRQQNAHSDSVFSIYFDGFHRLLSGGKDAYLKSWLINERALSEENAVPAHLFTINNIVEGPFNGLVTTASRDKSIRIWDVQTLLLQKALDRSKHPEASTHSVNRLLYLNKGCLISAGDDRVIRIFKISGSDD